ncbi:TonB-dependent receptor, partial [Pseudoalteromonas sp. S3178]
DPCSVDGFVEGTTDRALCEAHGVASSQVGVFEQANAQIEGSFGGNPDLKEETSETVTLGLVITPTENFDITIDYFDITIDDAIDVLGGGVNNILDICYNQLKDPSSEFCQAITRRPDGNVDLVTALN